MDSAPTPNFQDADIITAAAVPDANPSARHSNIFSISGGAAAPTAAHPHNPP